MHSSVSAPPAPPADHWINRYARLSQRLFEALGVPLGQFLPGQPLPQPEWVARSEDAASLLGWPDDWWQPAETSDQATALNVFTGNGSWPGMEPMATVYSGHQFGVWAGQLGDGRALLLGEVQTPHGPQEIQLKGAGRTPYSRGGDGRAVLRSSIREFLCSEAMHGLGIPTSRALCLTASPQPVRRETIETAAVVTRVAPSFIRFGHFEHFAHSGQARHHEALAALVDFVIEAHLPHLAGAAPGAERAVALLRHVVDVTADLMAQWQAVGFCHGVMNTDNMSILGLTIDYGPFGFLDGFDPNHICNHSDTAGRYRWSYQPDIGLWNCGALAQALVPLVPEDGALQPELVAALDAYEGRYADAMLTRWRAKLGLTTNDPEDLALVQGWLKLMAAQRADFTITFRRLGHYRSGLPPQAPENALVRDLFLDRPAFDAWAERYAARLAREGSVDQERQQRMAAVNPWVVLRNHLAEAAIRRAQAGDFSEVQRLHRVLQTPYTEQAAHAADADFPPEWASAIEVSCSS